MTLSVLYWSVAPELSRPVVAKPAVLVMRSLADAPVSLARAKVGAATWVSSVKPSVDDAVEVLPAASVCRTRTLLAPSPVNAILLPVPAVQVTPPLVLYFQLAPDSRPTTLTVP